MIPNSRHSVSGTERIIALERLAPPRMNAALAGTLSEVDFASLSIFALRQPGALRSDRLRQPSNGRTDDDPLKSLEVCD